MQIAGYEYIRKALEDYLDKEHEKKNIELQGKDLKALLGAKKEAVPGAGAAEGGKGAKGAGAIDSAGAGALQGAL